MDNKEDIMKDFSELSSIGGEQSSFDTSKKKKGINIWLILIILCILLLVGIVVYFAIFMLKPKIVMVNGMGKMLDSLSPIVEPLKVNYNIGDKFNINNTTTIIGSGEAFEEYKSILDNSKLTLNYKYDKTNKKMLLDLDSTIDNVNLVGNYYINDKENYMFIQDIYDKYIKLENLNIDLFEDLITKDDLIYIYNKFIDSLTNNIKEEWFERTINFDNGPTVISTLNLSKDDYISLASNVKTELLNDSKVIEILKLVYSQEDIDYLKNENVNVDFDKISLSVKQSIIRNNLQSVELITTTGSDVENILFENLDDKMKITSLKNDKNLASVEITINGKNFEIVVKEEENVDATIKGNEDNGYYTYTVISTNNNYLSSTDAGSNTYELSYKFKYIVNDNFIYDTYIGFKYQESEIIMSNKGSITNLAEDINVDISNYVDYKEVNQNEIINKLQSKFMPLILNFYTNNSVGYGDLDGI